MPRALRSGHGPTSKKRMTLRYLTPLSAAEQVVQGLDKPQPLAVADKVRFSELDVLNHVNNKAYMSWFESVRVAYFDMFCQPHFSAGARPRLVLRSADVRYVREILSGESYIATAAVTAFRNTSYTMLQQIWSGDLRAEMRCVMVLRSEDGTAGVPIPDSLRRQFTEQDGAEPDA